MDATLATPIAPVTPLPVNEVQSPSNTASAASGFDQALKQELNALKPEEDPKETAVKKDTDNTTAAPLDSALLPVASDAAAAQAFAAPAPIVQSFVTLPAGEVLTSAAAADESSELPAVVSAEVNDDPQAIESQAADAVRMTQSAPQLGAAQQSVVDPRGARPNAPLPNARLHDSALRQNIREENAGQRVEHAAPAKNAARTSQFTAPDAIVQAQLQAYEPERAVPAEPSAAATHFNVQPDALSSASLLARWSGQQPTVSDANPTPASARIDTPVGAPGWGEAFQQKMVWLVDRQQQSAELHINPPHLGPVEIMLNIGDEGANIMLCSPHAAVREAIEASLPDLRASLAERGLSLGQASVGSDSGAAREQFAEHVRNNANKPDLPAQASLVAQVARLAPRGLVDVFA
ncbi:MAG: flagellar hook-length control protein FliK [Pseudomonadota bacterium]